MSVQFEKTLSHAFVLDESKLLRIAETVEDEVGEIDISAICSDDGIRTFDSMRDFLRYENHKDKKVLSMRIYARSNERRVEEVIVSFRHDEVSLIVRGVDPYASQCKNNLHDILTGTRPWYWWLADKDFGFFLILYLGCSLLLSIYANWNESATTESDADSFSKGVRTLFLVSTIALGFLIAWVMAHVRRYLFPFSQFLIGQETQNAGVREWLRKIIVGATVTIFVGGLIQILG